MRKKLAALLSVLALLLAPSLVQAQAADSVIPDEQLMTPRPPVENTGVIQVPILMIKELFSELSLT